MVLKVWKPSNMGTAGESHPLLGTGYSHMESRYCCTVAAAELGEARCRGCSSADAELGSMLDAGSTA